MKADHEKILKDAERALVLYKAARPGSGNRDSRRINREQASALIMPFLNQSKWPKPMQTRAKKIDDLLITLI